MYDYEVVKDIDIVKDICGMSETALSDMVGVPRSTVNNWRRGSAKISKTYMEKVYSAFFTNNVFLNRMKEQSFCDRSGGDALYVFHGAKADFTEELSLGHSDSRNDFGRGIYLGDSFFQSASFVANYPDSSVYVCKIEGASDLKVVEYGVDSDWMISIAYNRGKLESYKDSRVLDEVLSRLDGADLVIAPIADNRMFRILDEFIEGNITDLQCRSALSATDLGKQYVVLSEKALARTSIVHHCYLCREEKQSYLSEKLRTGAISDQKVKYVKREFAGKGKYIEELLV